MNSINENINFSSLDKQFGDTANVKLSPPGLAARKSGPAEAANRPSLTFAVSPNFSSNETKIYVFINRVRRVVYRIFGGFFKNFLIPTSGRYLQTSALKNLIRDLLSLNC